MLEVLSVYEQDGLCTTVCDGVQMAKLSATEQAVVMKELEGHVRTLQGLRSNRIGGSKGIITQRPGVSSLSKSDKVWPLHHLKLRRIYVLPLRSITAKYHGR